jgi:hypothetical protein
MEQRAHVTSMKSVCPWLCASVILPLNPSKSNADVPNIRTCVSHFSDTATLRLLQDRGDVIISYLRHHVGIASG